MSTASGDSDVQHRPGVSIITNMSKASGGNNVQQSNGSRQRNSGAPSQEDLAQESECEVLGPGPEADESAYKWNNCTKNPGHCNFIPVSKFCIDNLHDKSLSRLQSHFDTIKALSESTVRLKVGYTSLARPNGYTFSGDRGLFKNHYGSGWVRSVFCRNGPCPSCACSNTSSPCQEWYEIHVQPACHVVFDEEEVRHTTVDFFFDDKESMTDGRVKTLSGLKVKGKHDTDDFSVFMCVTHDKDLSDRMAGALAIRDIAYPYFIFDGYHDPFLVVIVSHPHGQPKHITIGEWDFIDKHVEQPSSRSLSYTADTCPGSSGGPVRPWGRATVIPNLASHSDSHKQNGYNYSGSDIIFRM